MQRRRIAAPTAREPRASPSRRTSRRPSTEAAAQVGRTPRRRVGGHCVSRRCLRAAPADTALALLTGSGGTLSTGALPSSAPSGVTASGASAPRARPWRRRSGSRTPRRGSTASPASWPACSPVRPRRSRRSPVVLGIEHSDAARLNMTKGTLADRRFRIGRHHHAQRRPGRRSDRSRRLLPAGPDRAAARLGRLWPARRCSPVSTPRPATRTRSSRAWWPTTASRARPRTSRPTRPA